MMTSNLEHLSCLLCSSSVSQAAYWAHYPVIVPLLDKFLCQTLMFGGKISANDLLSSTKRLSLCGPCLSEVREATEVGQRVEEYEELARHLQQQLLKMMGELQALVDGYRGRMARLEQKLNKKKERSRNAKRFCEKVMSVNRELKALQRDLVTKATIAIKPHTSPQPRRARGKAIGTKAAMKLKEPLSDLHPPECPLLHSAEDNQVDPFSVTVKASPLSPEGSNGPTASRKKRGRRPFVNVKNARLPKRKFPEKSFQCANCGLLMKHSSHLQHQRTCLLTAPITPLSCPTCGKTGFKHNISLKQHQNREHSGELHPYASCGKQFGQTWRLRLHEQIHLPKKSRPSVTCELCGALVLRESLKRHRDCNCPATQAQRDPFKCEYCGKCFKDVRSLREHVKRLHDPQNLEKPFACQMCGRRFKLRKDMKLHQDSKHLEAEMPFKCGGCGRGFRLDINLQNHQKKCALTNTTVL